MTLAVELIFSALPEAATPEPPAEGVCCVTGRPGPTLDRKLAIKPSFTRLDLLAAPNSSRVGVPAWRALTHPPERKSSWWCDGGEFRPMRRREIRAMVLCRVRARRWCGYVTTSFKKHGSLLAPVNTGNRQLWLFEEQIADCSDRAAVHDCWRMLRRAQAAGMPREVLADPQTSWCPPAWMRAAEWLEFLTWATPRRLSPLYRMLSCLLPSRAELEMEGKES